MSLQIFDCVMDPEERMPGLRGIQSLRSILGLPLIPFVARTFSKRLMKFLYSFISAYAELDLPAPTSGDEESPCIPTQAIDVVFVCVDFENGEGIIQFTKNTSTSQSCLGEMGVSIFDKRDLLEQTSNPEDATRTYNYRTTSNETIDRTETDFKGRCAFGPTKFIHLTELLAEFEQHFDPQRKYVIVGHSLANDLGVLSSLGFNKEKHNIICTVDTQDLARQIFGNTLKLKHVPENLWIPDLNKIQFHVGRNDANLTLRAMLLLARRSYDGHEMRLDEKTWEKLQRLDQVGRTNVLPPRINRKRKISAEHKEQEDGAPRKVPGPLE